MVNRHQLRHHWSFYLVAAWGAMGIIAGPMMIGWAIWQVGSQYWHAIGGGILLITAFISLIYVGVLRGLIESPKWGESSVYMDADEYFGKIKNRDDDG